MREAKIIDILREKRELYFKKIKERKGMTLIALVITIIILLILSGITIVQLTSGKLFGKEKFEVADNIEFSYEKNPIKGTNKIQTAIVIKDEENGLNKVEYPNGDILYCNGKNKIGIDYMIEEGIEYKFKITSNNGYEKEMVVIKNIKPSEPVIELDVGNVYPIITPNGIQRPKQKVTIIYDNNDKLKNEYSEDSGITWKEYSEPFEVNSNASKIIAKSSYKEDSETSSESELNVIAQDAILPQYYDGSTDLVERRRSFKIY